VPSETLTLVVQLTLNADQREDYERFEVEASRIMQRHGGRIERRVRVTSPLSGTDRQAAGPDEVHLVSFPDEERFEAYRRDPELAALAELRARVILRTEIWRGTDLPPFASSSSNHKGGGIQ